MITANAERLKAAQLLLIRFIQIGRSGSKADAKRAAALQRSPAGWPIPNHGGFRIDTKSNAEIACWVFPKSSYSLERLARSISDPRYFLKLCGAAGDLQAALPSGGTLHAPGYFMEATAMPQSEHLPDGYRIEVKRTGMDISKCRPGAIAAPQDSERETTNPDVETG